MENKRRRAEARTAAERQKMDEELQVLIELQKGAQEVDNAEGVPQVLEVEA